ncbi:peptidoglycan/xylan/chitin deacetylase (PgdA/CDA1 family) [Bifidobacterium commune]|uniref:Peptidoglycan/xylan/chitin deacetylase, PgdA/CDA1 family n=1 Tax=Bifidobacterium commune TaxID=1505727 RepID=A0A1C4H292_9BIFI|nr:polysaccharide deacetylase family protein [Bifidobacterium commune]MBB2954897.1 peptidoglycan/xylan/chitin deacetylase (PgdA/CDA1 family) [Bifidobacterium commune]SCC79003.1 Peptidoglycan/xylan/chitin deacetylase, PgdA/CDA1 family [Bifidobacterium commune]
MVVVLVLAVAGVVSSNTMYSYYRKGMSRCVQWGNSYKLAAAHVDTLIAQDAVLVKSAQNRQDGTLETLSADQVNTAQATLESAQRRRKEIASQESANPMMSCSTKELTPKLNDETRLERQWTGELEKLIGDLNAAFKPLLVLYALDSGVGQSARKELEAVTDGVAAFARLQKHTVDSKTLQTLEHAIQKANADVANSAPYSRCNDDQEMLYRAADKVVKAGNKAKGIDCATQRCVALTFDDGPDFELTPQLVSYLQTEEISVTFFEMGQKVQADGGSLTRRLAQAGFPIGSHTWSHEDLPAIIQNHHEGQQLDDTAALIASAINVPVNFVRPPHGAVDEASRTYIGRKEGAAIAMYGVDSYDWSQGATSASLTRKIMTQIEPGSIVLMHDIHPHTVEAVPEIIAKLRKQGYRFVTIPELTEEYPRAGAVYYSRDDILRM